MAEFGNTFEGTGSGGVDHGYVNVTYADTTEAGTLTHIHIKMGAFGVFKCCIYDSDGGSGAPGTLLGLTVEHTISTGGWQEIAMASTVALQASHTYWLGFMKSTASFDVVYYNVESSSEKADTGNTYPTFPDPFVVGTTWENKLAIHGVYTPGAATLTQEGYRFRLDDGDQANATWAVAQDTGITAPANTVRRLRVLIDTSGDANAAQYQLEYKEANDANYTKVT